MQFDIDIPLLFNVSGYTILVAMFAYSTCKISVCLELASPEFLFNLRTTSESFSCCKTLDNRDYLRHTVNWDWLYEEMDVVFVCTYLQEFHLIPVLDFYTHPFHYRIHILIKYDTSVFCRKDQVIYENGNIVPLVCVFAHMVNLRRKRRGIQPGGNKRSYSYISRGWACYLRWACAWQARSEVLSLEYWWLPRTADSFLCIARRPCCLGRLRTRPQDTRWTIWCCLAPKTEKTGSFLCVTPWRQRKCPPRKPRLLLHILACHYTRLTMDKPSRCGQRSAM